MKATKPTVIHTNEKIKNGKKKYSQGARHQGEPHPDRRRREPFPYRPYLSGTESLNLTPRVLPDSAAWKSTVKRVIPTVRLGTLTCHNSVTTKSAPSRYPTETASNTY